MRILFDFDGTLVDSMPSYIAAMLRILDENNMENVVLYDEDKKPIIATSPNTIVVNNQLSESYSNKSLCGAGVTYKFCQVLDNILGIDLAKNYKPEYVIPSDKKKLVAFYSYISFHHESSPLRCLSHHAMMVLCHLMRFW